MVEFPVTVPERFPGRRCAATFGSSPDSVGEGSDGLRQTVNLSEYCSDPDGHPLDYTVRSSR